jgi:hypothetical protein
MAEPEAGFALRWQTRLEADSKRLQRRQSLAMLGFSMAGAAMILASLFILALPLLRSPSILFVTLGYRMLELVTIASTTRDFFTALFQSVSGSIPLLWWVLLTNPRRVTK